MSHTDAPYVAVETVDEACELLEEYGHDAKVIAGGQSLSLLLRQNLLDPAVIVDISGIPDLDGICVDDDVVRIGATTTYNTLKAHEESSTLNCLGDAVNVIADEQIRNFGTIGGAVSHADPSLDILPPLLCLDASLVVASPTGERVVPFGEFYDGYMVTDIETNEMVTEINVPVPTGPHGSAYEKFANVEGGWATVGVSASVSLSDDCEEITDAHVALAAVDDTPIRAPSAEVLLKSAPPTDVNIDEAASAIPEDIEPLDDIAGSAEYKRSVAARLGERCIRTALNRALNGELQ